MRLTYCYRHIAPYHHAQLNALALTGAEITVLSYDNFSGAAFRNEHVEPPKYTCKSLSSSGDTGYLYRSLEESSPDIVLVPGWGHAYALVALNWSILAHVPCVVISDSQECDDSRKLITENIKSRLVGLFSAGFVAGERSREYLIKLGMPAERIAIGCDVVDNDHFAQLSKQNCRDKIIQISLGLPDKYFLAVNRLTPEKNVATLIKAYAGYCSEGAPGGWGLVIVGAGILQDELKALVASLQIEGRVIFTGSVSYADIPACYALASTFVLASLSEPWGLVVNEAMSAGLPVLISDRCGSSVDLVHHGKNGFCFNSNDVEALAKLMKEMASDRLDISSMGLSSREIIAEWSVERYVAGIYKLVDIVKNTAPVDHGLFNRVLVKSAIRWLLKQESLR